MDISVSSIGDARSLVGGTLVLTPLKGLDGQVYAMAQGPIQVGGYAVQGSSGSRRVKNHLNVGRIPQGALVERPVPIELGTDGKLKIHLEQPDFATAQLMTNANQAATQLGAGAGVKVAVALSGGTVEVTIPQGRLAEIPAFIADLEVLTLTPNAVAKVVINGRTGTVVVGADVQISSVAVAHGALTVEVKEAPQVSQPNPMATGTTAVTNTTQVNATETPGAMRVVEQSAALASVVEALTRSERHHETSSTFCKPSEQPAHFTPTLRCSNVHREDCPAPTSGRAPTRRGVKSWPRLTRPPKPRRRPSRALCSRSMVQSLRSTVQESGLWQGVTGGQMYDHFIEQALSDHLAQAGELVLLALRGRRGIPCGTPICGRRSRQRLQSSTSDTPQHDEGVPHDDVSRSLAEQLPPQYDSWLNSPAAEQTLRATLSGEKLR